MANIAVLGYGTVGSGVVDVLEFNRDIIAQQQKKRLMLNMFLI